MGQLKRKISPCSAGVLFKNLSYNARSQFNTRWIPSLQKMTKTHQHDACYGFNRKCRTKLCETLCKIKCYQTSYYVTATAHVKIFEAKIRSNLTWHSNMLQTKDLSKKQIRNQKSPPRETTRREDVENSP